MLFGCRNGKAMFDGELRERFLEKYEQIKNIDGINIGWELIRQHFSED
jgi:hypothetical protein